MVKNHHQILLQGVDNIFGRAWTKKLNRIYMYVRSLSFSVHCMDSFSSQIHTRLTLINR